jgi:hypothetical protein
VAGEMIFWHPAPSLGIRLLLRYDPQKVGRAAEISWLPMPRDFMAATPNER